jgi:hypothetical protein
MPKKKSAAAAAKKVNKSAYVRSLPSGMAAKDIVAKAKSEGISLSISQVYTIRTNAKKQGKAPGKGGRRGRAAGAPRAGTKSAFVRGLPRSLSAKEVVEQAKARGMTLSVAQVYNIRSTASLKQKATRGRPAAAAAPAAATRAPAVSTGDAEVRLRRLIAEIGLQRAKAVLAEVQAAFEG